jgi:hypothetical protein
MARPEFSPPQEPRNTPQALIDHYERLAKPLRADAIRSLVEPLTGSSFADIVINDLRTKFTKKQTAPHTVTADDIYLSFFQSITDVNMDEDLKGGERRDAELAIWSHLSHAVSIDLIYPDHRLAPSEMAFWQIRHDKVWYDQEHTQEAFTHSRGEWRLYKNGRQLGSVPMQNLHYLDAEKKFHYPTFIPEGSPDVPFFHDYRRRGIGSIPAELQGYLNHARMLFVSEQFDFDLALRK